MKLVVPKNKKEKNRHAHTEDRKSGTDRLTVKKETKLKTKDQMEVPALVLIYCDSCVKVRLLVKNYGLNTVSALMCSHI